MLRLAVRVAVFTAVIASMILTAALAATVPHDGTYEGTSPVHHGNFAYGIRILVGRDHGKITGSVDYSFLKCSPTIFRAYPPITRSANGDSRFEIEDKVKGAPATITARWVTRKKVRVVFDTKCGGRKSFTAEDGGGGR